MRAYMVLKPLRVSLNGRNREFFPPRLNARGDTIVGYDVVVLPSTSECDVTRTAYYGGIITDDPPRVLDGKLIHPCDRRYPFARDLKFIKRGN